jgi:alpha-L-fucosidase
MTMNDTWGYKQSDNDWKSPRMLIHNLIDCASKGGNYLLNVGPTAEGLIPEASIDRLREVGLWMRTNGESINGTAASPFSRPFSWGRCTEKVAAPVTTLYLHVFDWPSGGQLVVPGLKNKPQAVYLLGDSKKHRLAARLAEGGLTVSLPTAPADPNSSTIVLRINAPLAIEPVLLLITQSSDGSIRLRAGDAALHGSTLQYESGGSLDNIGYWTNPDDWADWNFKVARPGQFKVLAEIAAPSESSFDVQLGLEKLHCAAPLTGSYRTFKTVELGVLNVASAGRATLAVHPDKDHWQAINLKAVTLQPLGQK